MKLRQRRRLDSARGVDRYALRGHPRLSSPPGIILANRRSTRVDRDIAPRQSAQYSRQSLRQFNTIARVNPLTRITSKVETSGRRGQPDLPGWGISVDDHFRAIVELDFEDTLTLESAIAIEPGGVDASGDFLEHLVGVANEFGLIHTRAKITFIQ